MDAAARKLLSLLIDATGFQPEFGACGSYATTVATVSNPLGDAMSEVRPAIA